jgi:hypothetical protein
VGARRHVAAVRQHCVRFAQSYHVVPPPYTVVARTFGGWGQVIQKYAPTPSSAITHTMISSRSLPIPQGYGALTADATETGRAAFNAGDAGPVLDDR